MKTTVSKKWLIGKVMQNRKEHRAIFERAMEGFRVAAIARFEKNIERAKAGKPIEAYFNMTQPIDQTKEYDRALGMLENATTDTIELSAEDYAHLVQDEWDWKQNFTTSTSAYLSQGEDS